MQRKRVSVYLSSYSDLGILQPPMRYEERFSFSSDCRAVKQVVAPRPPMARDEDKPDSREVKHNEGTSFWIRYDKMQGEKKMSEFLISCPSCGDELKAYSEYVGRKAQCPSCGTRFVITNNVTPCDSPDASHFDTEDTDMGNADTLMTDTFASSAQRKPIATIVLITVSLLATLILFCKTGTIEPDARTCVTYGANLRPLTMGGQWWRLVASSFLHFDIKHLVMNMLCLYSIGCLLEKLVGHAKLLELYFFTAIIGSLTSCIFHNEVCAGASGAVFGLFGAEVAYIIILHKKLGLKSEDLIGYMKGGIIFIAINFAYGLMPGIDMSAHVGGLFGGLAIGAMVASAIKEGGRKADLISHSVSSIAILGVVVLAVSLVTGKNAGHLSVSELTARVSQMLVENMNKGEDKNGSFEVIDISLAHGNGNHYYGNVEMAFKYGEKTFPLKSHIEVVHDALETSYELDKDDLANFQKSLRMDVDELKVEVSRMLADNIVKGLKKEGCKNVSVNVKYLSLVHDGNNKYHGRSEIECKYDGETEMLKSRIDVTYDGETISYEIKE